MVGGMETRPSLSSRLREAANYMTPDQLESRTPGFFDMVADLLREAAVVVKHMPSSANYLITVASGVGQDMGGRATEAMTAKAVARAATIVRDLHVTMAITRKTFLIWARDEPSPEIVASLEEACTDYLRELYQGSEPEPATRVTVELLSA
jgi:hypothetical protein